MTLDLTTLVAATPKDRGGASSCKRQRQAQATATGASLTRLTAAQVPSEGMNNDELVPGEAKREYMMRRISTGHHSKL